MSERERRIEEEVEQRRRADMAQQLMELRGRQPMPQRMTQGPGMPAEGPQGMAMQPGAQGEPFPREVRAVRTAEAEDAYQLGARMGAASLAGGRQGAAQAMRAPIDKNRLKEAENLLLEYKRGKSSVDQRIIRSQEWWKLRNWPQIENERGTRGASERKSATAWLWNCIVGKHADAMDSYPEPVVLPRMAEDKAEAQILSEILPVVLQINGFEKTYSDCQWQKMLEGTAAYHIGWDKTKLGGIGDICIKKVNMLNLYWEPGVDDIQESENVFYVQVVDNRRLEQQYPQLRGKLKTAYLKPSEYRKDDGATMDNKSVMVDWYYHVWEGNRKILHFCQFVNDEILYSTEKNGETEGLYADGDYPFQLDPLFPVEGSPAGYGYIDIGKDAQIDIDTLNQAMVKNAVVTSTPRYFIRTDGGINEDEFADWSKPFVHTNGMLGENDLRAIESAGIQGNAMNMLERKIDELKFITGNTDVDNGATPSGVTAASAIAALQEKSGRTSKDSTRAAYRSYNSLISMVIERIRQFYDIPRQFRILGKNGQEKFIEYSNARLQDQQIMGGLGMAEGLRRPVFDIEVRSQRETAYTKVAQNELAIQFLQMGVFNPQLTDQSLMMLDMMEFKGKEEMMQKVEANGTIQQALMQVGQIALMLAQKHEPQVVDQLAGVLEGIGIDAGMVNQGQQQETAPDEVMEAQKDPTLQNNLVSKARERAGGTTRIE
jgi:hypothetical protein